MCVRFHRRLFLASALLLTVVVWVYLAFLVMVVAPLWPHAALWGLLLGWLGYAQWYCNMLLRVLRPGHPEVTL